jgi:pimeloyl-ACP methyl ester carboxylesterase
LAVAAERAVLSIESEAALRQFSNERLMGYGVTHADAMELRGRVQAGEEWKVVAVDLANACLWPPEVSCSATSAATKVNRLFRASALMRMSQMMMLSDSEERRQKFARAAGYYLQASELKGDRQKTLIETGNGPLIGWTFPVRDQKLLGTAIVIGGVEGWAMDFSALGVALARRGVEALVLDGPGQGESRMTYGHYLTRSWARSYRDVIEFLLRKTGNLPLAFIGNSMGGSLAVHLAARDARISVCCDNGGPAKVHLPAANKTFASKMVAHCGLVPEQQAADIWFTANPLGGDAILRSPFLLVHGGLDPLVSSDDAQEIFKWVASTDKTMVVYSDGDHCVYNHSDDKLNLIGDWVADRLAHCDGPKN